MEQLYLFAPPEITRNRAMDTLVGAEFIRSERYWRELRRLDPDNGFIDVALDICRFWNRLYPEEDRISQADPLEVYRRWKDFEAYLVDKDYRGNAIIGQIKEHVFLKTIGLEHRSPALRESFERHGIEILDLLMEVGAWALAAEEVKTVRMRDPACGGGAFLLKCSKVYSNVGNISASRRFLLEAFWDAPDRIELHDIIDPVLLEDLEDLYLDYDTREGSVELIPYVGLMSGSFTLPLEDRLRYLSSLRKNARRHETNNDRPPDARIRYRLFSLYAWESEVAQLTAASYTDARNRMKALDKELFAHYMGRKQSLEGGHSLPNRAAACGWPRRPD